MKDKARVGPVVGMCPAQYRPMRNEFLLILFSSNLAIGALGCPEKGPMEKAGEKIDNAAEELSDAVQNDGPLERAGEKLDESVDTAGEKINEAAEDAKEAL